ncbi:MAG: hypothetical protein QNJ45_14430 [Ardenticatenaceae bacterium]|nr:hypothetical protein [Ardenticatenaceae bacterium]
MLNQSHNQPTIKVSARRSFSAAAKTTTYRQRLLEAIATTILCLLLQGFALIGWIRLTEFWHSGRLVPIIALIIFNGLIASGFIGNIKQYLNLRH